MQGMLDETDPLTSNFFDAATLEVGPLNRISEYRLDRKCFHMIILGMGYGGWHEK